MTRSFRISNRLRTTGGSFGTTRVLLIPIKRWQGTCLIRSSPLLTHCSELESFFQQNGDYERAIETYNALLENARESVWQNEAIYQRAVCYRAIREFEAAAEGLKVYRGHYKGIFPED